MSRPLKNYNPSTLTALVVDDQFLIRKAVSKILNGMGFEKILEASDGAEAFKILDQSPVDLVITDLFMPVVDGFQTIKHVRERDFGADTPIIVVTGESGRDEIVKAIDLGADDYVVKPFQIGDLEKKVNSILSKYFEPTTLLKLLRSGDRLSVAGQTHDALKCFEAAERLSPDSPRAKFSKAVLLKKMGHTDEAVRLLESLAQSNPSYFKTFKAKADILIEQNMIPEAITSIRRELELNPKQPERQISVARLLREEGDLLGSLEHYRLALKEEPRHKDALIEAGKTCASLDKTKEALTYFKRARRFYPSWSKPVELSAQLLKAKFDEKTTLNFFLDEIRQHPNQVDLRIMLAKLHEQRRDIPEALQVLDDGLRKNSNDVALMKAKAATLKRNHQAEKACEVYKDVLKLDPSHTNELLLASALIQDRQFHAAHEQLETSLQTGAEMHKVIPLMIEALKNLANPTQALILLEALKATVIPDDHQNRIHDWIKSTRSELLKLRIEGHGPKQVTKKTG
jgi:DNA-binding response OmpR family regulator